VKYRSQLSSFTPFDMDLNVGVQNGNYITSSSLPP